MLSRYHKNNRNIGYGDYFIGKTSNINVTIHSILTNTHNIKNIIQIYSTNALNSLKGKAIQINDVHIATMLPYNIILKISPIKIIKL